MEGNEFKRPADETNEERKQRKEAGRGALTPGRQGRRTSKQGPGFASPAWHQRCDFAFLITLALTNLVIKRPRIRRNAAVYMYLQRQGAAFLSQTGTLCWDPASSLCRTGVRQHWHTCLLFRCGGESPGSDLLVAKWRQLTWALVVTGRKVTSRTASLCRRRCANLAELETVDLALVVAGR